MNTKLSTVDICNPPGAETGLFISGITWQFFGCCCPGARRRHVSCSYGNDCVWLLDPCLSRISISSTHANPLWGNVTKCKHILSVSSKICNMAGVVCWIEHKFQTPRNMLGSWRRGGMVTVVVMCHMDIELSVIQVLLLHSGRTLENRISRSLLSLTPFGL